MPSFQHFQNQAEQKANKPKFANEALSLSGLMQFADSAKKQSFEAVCRVLPLVKTYRQKIDETAQAIAQTESSLGDQADIPPDYSSALNQVKEGFSTHLGALDDWMDVLNQKDESRAESAKAKVKQSGERLQASLQGLTVPS